MDDAAVLTPSHHSDLEQFSGGRGAEVPNWFYNTYQRPDGSIDLDKLWADINSGGPSRTRSVIAGHLRYEFGGYCSEEQVRKFLDGRIAQLDTPWRDAGC